MSFLKITRFMRWIALLLAVAVALTLAVACGPAATPVPTAVPTPPPAVVATSTPLPVLEPVEAWKQIGSLMKEARDLAGEGKTEESQARVEEARALYTAVFQEEAGKLDASVDQLVTGALDRAATAAQAGDKLQVNLERQRVDKSIYKIAFLVLEEELAEGEIDEAEEWFALLAEKFKLYKEGEPSGAAIFVEELKRKPDELDELRPQILEEFRTTFLLKVEEEVLEAIEALEAGDSAEAAEKAVEGQVYYLSIQPDVRILLGEEEDKELFRELEELLENALEGNLEEASHEAEEIATILGSYKSAKLGGGLAVVVKDLMGMLRLVDEEYVDAVADGKIVDQGEYTETKLFLERAEEILEANREMIAAVDAELVAQLDEALASIGDIVEALGDPAEVTTLVANSTDRLAALAGAAAPSISELELTSATAAPGKLVTIFLKAEGVPAPGLGAYDVTVKFDPSVLELENVSFVYGAGVADTAEGQARLAGFQAQQAASGEVELVELSFRLAATATGAIDVALEVNELSDAEGNPLTVSVVEKGVISSTSG
ncbi:MAG: cohesin domain-containing protein [Anaerolineae bacterium]